MLRLDNYGSVEKITKRENGYQLTAQVKAASTRGYRSAQSSRTLHRKKGGPANWRQYRSPAKDATAVLHVGPRPIGSWWIQPMTWQQFTETAQQRFLAPSASLALALSPDGMCR